ncbi:PDK repeat-containing protein, partial [Thermoplasmatales archaeon SCGC AB-539-N05]
STNHPPDKPEKPSGPPNGLIGEEYTYTTLANDTDKDHIAYLFDWGDGFTTRVPEVGYVPSGTSASVSHRWFQRGAYNVIARSEDENGIMSNSWSDPLIVTISSGTPIITVNMHRIHNLYPLDKIDNPYDDGDYPEWYYKITAESEETYVDRFHNTDTGDWRDNYDKWISDNDWYPDIEHSYYEDPEFQADSRNIHITIKLMDHDTGKFPEYGDDLADISGSDDPDDGGYNNGIPDKRGAIFHGVYDLVSSDLTKSESDYYEKDPNGIYYIIRGDDEPDGSENYEADPLDAENDAEVWFAIYDDYEPPQATIQITNMPDTIRPNYNLEFTGTVTNGTPSYNWYWDFGDGATSEEQNPTRQYANNGIYTVTLTVTDGFNQKNSQTIELNVVEQSPNAPAI